MRSLSLLLLLANILYFTWAGFVDVDIRTSTPQEDFESTNTIRLASEVSSRDEKADSFRTFSALEASDCVSVGPFLSLSEAARATATLSAAEFESQQRIEQGEIWAGYRVFIPNVGNQGEAESIIRLLQENGIQDVVFLPDTDGTVLSLGIFLDPAHAYRRAQTARKLGLMVRTQERKRPGTLYWIDARPLRAGAPLDPSMFPPEPGKIVRIELQPCPKP